MAPEKKKSVRRLILSSIVSGILIVAFSVPLGDLPIFGNLLFVGNGIWNVNAEVPKYEKVVISGITEDITVYRDEWGVPHIYGSNQSDVIFALGYVQAQDRLFQMDIARRLTFGKISEVLGSAALDTDKYNLNMMKYYWSNETYQDMLKSTDPDTQLITKLLQSYAAGVNEYITTHKYNLPLEFYLMGYTPQPWTPVDTIGFAKYMAESLCWEYYDLYAMILQNVYGSANYTELYGLPLPYQIPICPGYGNFADISAPTSKLNGINPASTNTYPDPDLKDSQSATIISNLAQRLLKGISNIPQEAERIESSKGEGPNNWVVNGSKTASGKPILCNDMHLAFNMPGIWYEAHLVCNESGKEFNAYGFTISGVPLIVVGHTDYIAWGFTNVAYDVMDWYYYNGINDTHYWYKGVATEYGKIPYQIPVKGGKSQTFTIKTTVHGPVFNGFIDSEIIPAALNNTVIATNWLAMSKTSIMHAFYGFLHAKNRADFDTASTYFDTPAQNMIYADIQGNIGIRPTGKVPIRNDTGIPTWNTGNGSMPYNGSAGQGEWIGYVPFANLSHAENPTQCYLASANQISAGPDYLNKYSLQHPLGIDEGYRARQINTLLASHNSITVDDMKSFQLESYSPLAGNITGIMLNALNTITTKSTLQQNVIDLMTAWNYRMDKESPAAAISEIWWRVLREETYADDLIGLPLQYMPSVAVLEKHLRTNTGIWFDNLTTTAIETREDTIIVAFNRALAILKDYFKTDDIAQWKWGSIHQIYLEHLTGVGTISRGPYPYNGSSYTLSPGFLGEILKDGKIYDTNAQWGASERMIIDFNDLNKSISVIPSGQRGVATSKHFDDQLQMYMKGEYHTQYFGSNSITKFQAAWVESTLIMEKGGN